MERNKNDNTAMKREIARWILSGENLDLGRALLAKWCPRPFTARLAHSMSPGRVAFELKSMMGTLQKELFKKNGAEKELARRILQGEQNNKKKANNETEKKRETTKNGGQRQDTVRARDIRIPAAGTRTAGTESQTGAPPAAIDASLARAKELCAKMAQTASMIHKALWDTGMEETKEKTAVRKTLAAAMKALCTEKETLWQTKEAAFRGEKTRQETEATNSAAQAALENAQCILEDARAGKTPAAEKKTKKDKKGKEEIAAMSETELLRRQENLRKNITRTMNRLEYQTDTRQAEPNPMPQGDRRKLTLARLEDMKRERSLIERELRRRAKEAEKKGK